MGGSESWVGQDLQDYLGEANNVSQVDGVSDMVPTCWFVVLLGDGSEK